MMKRGATSGPVLPRRTTAAVGLALAVALALAPVFAAPAAAAGVPEPDGYRLEEYRAPVPDTLAGATVLDTAAAEALWKSGDALFLDAMPRPVKPQNLPAGTVWHDKPRTSIAGSHWLINTGYGKLSPEAEVYFESRLAALTGDDRSKTLVFFCEPECWMSWNAAKRALSLGYEDVRWYPGGATEWAAAGLPTVTAAPLP
jgi:PQQ-dependent catabolism-associated CXXCW motif protein